MVFYHMSHNRHQNQDIELVCDLEKFPYVASWGLFYTSHHCHVHSLFSLSVWNIFIVPSLTFLSTNFIICNDLFLFIVFQFVRGYISCILTEGHILNFTFFYARVC